MMTMLGTLYFFLMVNMIYLEFNHKILLEFECLDGNHYIKRIAFNTEFQMK